jgi:hypothetical protein
VSARARFDQEEQGLDPVVVCAGKMSAAQPWRWHNADNMRTTRVCAHMTPGKRKARPWLDGGVLSRVGVGGKPKLGDARRTKERHNCKAKERARR